MAYPTADAIRQQTTALGGGPFEVGVLLAPGPAAPATPAPAPGTTGPSQMLLRQWTTEDILKSLAWLRAKNVEGAAIYIRPLGEHAFSLIDDLNRESVARLSEEGFAPCLVVETSPGNFQAWLHHGRTLSKELSTAVARALASRFGGDPGSADWRHFGRLAGFTNRKPKHQREDGFFPYVHVHESQAGLVYGQAADFVGGIERELAEAAQAKENAATQPKKPTARSVLQRYRTSKTSVGPKSIADFHADARYQGDLSRADLAYAIHALGRGDSEASVRQTIHARDMSKKGVPARVEQYVDYTIAAARRHLEQAGPLKPAKHKGGLER